MNKRQLVEWTKTLDDTEFSDYVQEISKFADDTNRTDDVVVVFPVDLRQATQTIKINMSHHKTKWTAFINNAGTLGHFVNPVSGTLVRYVFKFPLKTLSPKRQYTVVKSIINRMREAW